MSGQAATSDHVALLALLGVALLVAASGKAATLARLPLVLVGGLVGLVVGLAARAGRGLVRWAARTLGWRWPQWCWLAVTILLVGQARRRGINPHAAWTAAAFAWGAWLTLRVRARARLRTAPKRYATAMRKTAAAMEATARTPTAARAATRARRAAKDAARTAEPLPVVPPPPAAPTTVKGQPPPAPEPFWAPGETPLDPILPRWLGGGWLRRRRRSS